MHPIVSGTQPTRMLPRRLPTALLLCGLLLAPALAETTAAANEPFDQGVAALNQGNYAAAAERFTEALKLNPDLPEAYVNRGIARLKLDQPVEAVGASAGPGILYLRGLQETVTRPPSIPVYRAAASALRRTAVIERIRAGIEAIPRTR